MADKVTEKMREDGLETLQAELSEAVQLMKGFRDEVEAQGKALKALNDDVEARKGDTADLQEALKKQRESFGDAVAKMQATEEAVTDLSKQIDQPFYSGSDGDRKAKDTEVAIELQRRIHLSKDGLAEDFRPDMDNIVKLADVRSAVRKLMRVGQESRDKIVRSFTDMERKAFEAASLDQAMFMPEMLGIEIDCNPECAYLLDLYEQVRVNRSQFMYPVVQDYGAIGMYDCDAKCDGELGPEGNITFKQGQTFDFRGVFCFNRDVLREANYDLLGFMFRAANRSHRINRNRALIAGEGVNEPMGWLTQGCFMQRTTAAQNPTHVELRKFLSAIPMEYGSVTAVMHQNMFSYFAAIPDNNGRFIFGDGMMCYDPMEAGDKVRISNCLPDATEGGTKGSVANPIDAGAFIMAAANWETAYKSVEHRPMSIEQFEGGSGKWCVKYQFGAKDGGFVGCCAAGQTLHAGAA